MYRGYVTEMATGEGKTLTAGLTGVLFGWSGRPVHVVTVNDYLADRDAKRLAPLYEFCGVSVGSVVGEMEPAARREGYSRDVTYTTCKEIVADFLRDRLWLDTLQDVGRRQIWALSGRARDVEKGLVMRGIHSCIVDEADSVLIDEAVTPLIISQPRPNEPFVEACRAANKMAADLEPGVDYRVNSQFKDVEILPGMEDRLEERAGEMPALFRGPDRRRELVQQALHAKEFFHKDVQYVIQEGKVVIVDEFTGRLMPQRTWRAGLHQIIEAKEGMTVTPPSETLARLSFQRFYRFFHRLAGMTGTAKESAGELWRVYGLRVIPIPQNRPCQRKDLPRLVFPDQESKWQAIVDDIVAMHREGRPILVGTRSVKTSEELARRLFALEIECRVLNAVRHKEEADIVAEAGQKDTITVATNMAGRGTDILLGHGVAHMGGLHVIATECHESGRIDRQLFGRSARQGDPGSARSFVSMEDELIRRFVPGPARRAIKAALEKNSRFGRWAADKAVLWAQARAQRMAVHHRHSVLKTDTWLEDSLSFARGDIGR
jgi:preprotein translocase subunit SecA